MNIERPPEHCPQCGTHWAAGILACPQCGRLVYSGALSAIAVEAQTTPDRTRAIALWRAALSLLPAGAGQRQAIEATIAGLQQEQARGVGDREAIEHKSKSWRKWLGVAAPAAAFLATKGKFLILGLTKLPTLASMLVFMSFYWERWGWGFALGFVLCIYIHEMGHVITLKHYGIPASAPLFIPGFGAVIFARQRIDSPAEDAHVGLAGPAAGLLAALSCVILYALTENRLFLALTVFGAYINLFNLIPILFLDGSRGYRGLSGRQRWMVIAIAGHLLLHFRQQPIAGYWRGDGGAADVLEGGRGRFAGRSNELCAVRRATGDAGWLGQCARAFAGGVTETYSCRRARIGSSRAARRAGTKPAAPATEISMRIATPAIHGSCGLTP
jgi:Zn-dependent protease